MDAEEYDGGRTAGDIVAWAEAKLEEFAEPPEIREVHIYLLDNFFNQMITYQIINKFIDF